METRHESSAFWVTGPGRGEIRAELLSPRQPHEVTVRTLYSGISRGSESMVFRGEVPNSEYQRMRAPYQEGDFPSPVKYGYINVGTVQCGPDHLRGQAVFCLYPHQTIYNVPAHAVHVLPPSVPAERAVLAANLETAINGLWDGCPRIGDRVAVIGAGTLGCLMAWLLGKIPGVRVELIDIDPDKEEIAVSLGVPFTSPECATPEMDLVFHCSASQAGLNSALELAAFEACIIEMSWHGDRAVTLPLGEGFHAKRLQLRSSQVSTIAPFQRARWDAERRMRLALGLLADPMLDLLISGEDSFVELPLVMRRLSRHSAQSLCHRITYL